ncbi:shikimate kinase [Bacillus canaveralius]|uniref:Shikimate kinase n=1 Tax=Bacillus canaveralius TaxID=1403243 RepID=A0A2N5GQR2_9BACI|nr:shikimate kinase [Bacillus canaveralius]PLR85404.1 shikimate kinase [Bacillus canaveralius]PLR94961.1 shikimate kinase [Bacillus canaveralius]RSK48146.1 shikimate kinase [Bacillus canaveralius]
MKNREVSLRERSIVFIGFMGVGKTTIGKLVAKKLYRDFIDIDDEIEKEFNMPVSQIFEKIGEKAFREREKSLIIDLSKQKLHIISVGGGAFLQEEIREECLASCIVFFLDLSWESWKERISLIIDSRPVLQGRSIDEIKELFYKRQEIYSTHHSKVQTDNHDIEEIADYIVDSLKLAWDIYEPNK